MSQKNKKSNKFINNVCFSRQQNICSKQIAKKKFRRFFKIIQRNLLRSENIFKGSLDVSHFILEINIGKRRIRHTTTLKLYDKFLDRLKIDSR